MHSNFFDKNTIDKLVFACLTNECTSENSTVRLKIRKVQIIVSLEIKQTYIHTQHITTYDARKNCYIYVGDVGVISVSQQTD